MYIIKNTWIWIKRFRHCRGFGVQSPFAFNFINDIINEHDSYYAYDSLADSFPSLNKRDRKLCQLYLRLANYCQSEYVVFYYPIIDVYHDYVKAGCRVSCLMDTTDNPSGLPIDQVKMVLMSIKGDYENFFQSLLCQMSRDGIIIIQGINDNNDSKAFWKSVKGNVEVGVTFDLYYVGIAFVDTKRFKQNYIVNF